MRISCLLIVGALVGMTGCGQKGPLVLPDAQHPPHKKIRSPQSRPTPAPAPAPTATTPPAADQPPPAPGPAQTGAALPAQ
jgi:predicted small lipoprotein YifL